MRTRDIEPGKFYRVRLGDGQTDLVRVDGFEPERVTGHTVCATSARVSGLVATYHRPHDVLRQANPSARTLRIWAMLEGESDS